MTFISFGSAIDYKVDATIISTM